MILRRIVIFCSGKYRFWVPLVCGLAYSLAFPPFSNLLHPIFSPFPFLSFVVLIPLFFFATRKPRRRALLYSYIFCAAMIFGQKYWIANVSQDGLWIGFIYIGVALISIVWGALYFGAAMAFRLCVKKMPNLYMIIFPAIWVLIDYFRTLTDLAFPWSYIGYGASGILPLAQFSSFTGIWGLTYLIVLGNVIIFEFLRACIRVNDKELFRRRRFSLCVWAALTFGIFVWGVVRMNMPPQDTVATESQSNRTSRIALMQSFMDQYNWEFNVSIDTAVTVSDSMIRQIENENIDLVIFPESALLCHLERRRDIRAQLFLWSLRVNAPIMVGALHAERKPNFTGDGGRSHFHYNSAFLTDPEFLTNRDKYRLLPYHKIMLVPFSEIMPFEADFPILSRVNLGGAGFSRGTEESVFRVNDRLEIAPYICYEAIFPDFVRRRLRASTNLLVNITNDGWFGRSSGPYQHAAMSQMRSIENGIWQARSANSGISMFVDPHGRIHDQTNLYVRDIVIRDIPATRVVTFYSRYGDWFVVLCAIATLIAIIITIIPKKRMGEITNPILIDDKDIALANT